MTNRVKTEIERLHALGFAVHLLKPRSKRPVKLKWTTGPRESVESLLKGLRPDSNIGVRLGAASVIAGGAGYLAVIDIDVKGVDPRYAKEAMRKVRELFPELNLDSSRVLSGRGNGSAHLYIVTPTPAAPTRIAVSEEKVKVFMPSAAISKTSAAELNETELSEGYRIRPAWEVSLMGEGQQVVLPPSVHPDSGKEYKWVGSPSFELPLVELTGNFKKVERTKIEDFTPVEVDLDDTKLTEEIKDLIRTGDGEDMSAVLFRVVIEMVKLGWKDTQIMSVLTDRDYELGNCAYNHTGGGSRKRAADWLFNYTIKKVRRENDASLIFENEVEVTELGDEEAREQAEELLPRDWRLALERTSTGKNAGRVKPTLGNLILILQNAVSPVLFKRDLFSSRDAYGARAPWGKKKGDEITDDDALLMKMWFSDYYGFEPDVWLIHEAICFIAVANSFHPVREYILSLQWDGVIRIDTWLKDYLGAKGREPYLSDVSKKILMAMVARVFRPGVKFDHIPVFEGVQGIGKSSAARILASEAWFADNLPDLRHPDARLNLQGKWIVEMSELATLKQGELELIKSYIASPSDRVRPPYGRKALDLKRQCVFIGTTNETVYLKDKTGNRRFWAVEVGQCDFKGLAEVRDQLFAEAYFAWHSLGEDLYLSGPAKEQAEEAAEERVSEDVESIMASDFTSFLGAQKAQNPENLFPLNQFHIKDLFNEIGPFGWLPPVMVNLIWASKILKANGYEKYKSNGTPKWRPKRA